MVLVTDERDLVVRIRAGDVDAFGAVFRRYYDGLVTFARTSGAGQADAEDLVHDVLLRIWSRHEKLEIRESLASFLYSSVRHEVWRSARHAGVVRRWTERITRELHYGDERSSVPADAALGARPLRSDERLEAAELSAVVQRAVAALPPRCREVYLLSREHGLSYAEIAAATGTSIKTVETQKARAFAALRKAVTRWRG